ncbi:MAG: hypothetical protein H7Y17_09650 [Chlorobia bacterium]|nr:hypothetical protein [Fimbriimonadaceae bacterium]
MRALLISYGQWHGPARLPRALKRFGFEVGLVCHPDNLAAKTRFVDRYFFGKPKDESEVLRDLVQAIEAYRPDVVIPGLEPAVVALLTLLKMKDDGLLPQLSEDSVKSIRRSIFDPALQRYFHSKIDLIDEMAKRGVRTPPQRELHTLGDADAFVTEHGFPVVLKPDAGYGGSDIAFCGDEESLVNEVSERLRSGTRRRWSIQRLIDGPTAMVQFYAVKGDVKVAYSLLRVKTNPEGTGLATVVQLIKNEEMEFAARILAELMNYNGFGSIQFALPQGSGGEAYMFEANMRPGVSMHLGEMFGDDLCRALYQHHSNSPYIQSEPRIGTTVALYPQELIRDPNSEFLQGIVDSPDDDPGLLEHFQGLIEAATQRA